MSDWGLPAVTAAAPGESAVSLEILLFGPLEVRIGPHPLPRLRSRKGLWLLALLALRAGRSVERGWLAETLWPDGDPSDARRSLRQSLHDLRLALGAEARRLVAEEPRTLRLELDGAFVDALAFDDAIARGDSGSLMTAVRLYRGPLLQECAEEWSLEERQRRERAYLAALERLAAAAAERGEYAAAAGYLRLAVGADPYREDLQRVLMQALAASGSPAGALVVYRQLRALLWREMAAEPAEETTSLFRQLREETRARARARDRRPSMAGTPPPPAPANGGNLPQPLSAFVGRERELLEIGACLAGARLVTLTGIGGIGKTRLALRVAKEGAGEYADGAWFVDLAALADPTLVPQAVARAVQVPESPGRSMLEALQEALHPRQMLLVLDNCEHMIDECARLADGLLSSCPHLRILATSRQALGLTGEVVWPVPPLSLPEPAGSGGQRPLPRHAIEQEQEGWAPGSLLQYEAVRLFVERAAAAAGFALGESNASATVQVCRRLDGIPLAIELATARLKVLSVEQLATRLDDRFRLLTGGNRAALPRQQTLRATLDWSYDLLSEAERALLRRLSVFSGGWTLEAAEAVCGECGVATDQTDRTDQSSIRRPQSAIRTDDVLDLLTQLLDRSLVGVESREGSVRYTLLETTRDYARDRLREAGESDERRERHAAYFLALAERAEPEFRGAAQAQWLQRLEQEHDNFRAAIEFFLAQEAVEEGLRLGSALGSFWWTRGYLSEGRERLQALLAQSGCAAGARERDGVAGGSPPAGGEGEPGRPPPGVRLAQAKALNAAGVLADDQSDYEAARAMFRQSLALFRELGDQAGAARALLYLGGQAARARDFPVGRAFYEESLAIFRALGDEWWAASALTGLGRLALREGEYATARDLVESGLRIYRQFQDRRAIARSLLTLGSAAVRQGDAETAQSLYEESLSIARQLEARGLVEETLNVLGAIALERGDLEAARLCHEERLTIARDVGNAAGVAESLHDLALVARGQGDGCRARTIWAECLAICQRLGEHGRVAECLEGVASLAVGPDPRDPGPDDHGTSESREPGSLSDCALQATRLLSAAAALRERAGAPVAASEQAEYDRQVAAARARLDEAAFAAAWAEGRAMSPDEAIAEALRGG